MERRDRDIMMQKSMVIVVMGVSGSGKTAVGDALAARLNWGVRGYRRLASGSERRKDA